MVLYLGLVVSGLVRSYFTTQGGIPLKLDIGKYRAVFFDIDGVLHVAHRIIPGAADALAFIRRMGLKTAVITNNTGVAAASIQQGLAKLGLDFHSHEIVSALTATATWLSKQKPGAKVYALAWPEAEAELRRLGLAVIASPADIDYKCDYLVVGGCGQMTKESLTNALRVALAGAKFVAISMDRTYPGKGGLFPGAGAAVGAVSGMLGRGPDVLIGKPSPVIAEVAFEILGVDAAHSLIVGDTLDVDIALGRAVGMDTALVLTGNARMSDITPDNAPTYVLKAVADICPGGLSASA